MANTTRMIYEPLFPPSDQNNQARHEKQLPAGFFSSPIRQSTGRDKKVKEEKLRKEKEVEIERERERTLCCVLERPRTYSLILKL